MRIINKMIVQPNTPNDNKVLWLNKSSASYYNNGTWITIGESSEDRKEFEEKIDSLDRDIQTVEKEIQDINSRHNSLNTKHESLSRTVQDIAVTGGASTATNVTYNNDSSGLNAENAQDAIDELQGSKIDKTSILQESGNAEDKVMSQKVISAELSNVYGAIDEVSKAIEQAKGEYICLFSENGYYYPFEQKVNKAGYIVAYIDGEFDDTEFVNIEIYNSTNTNLIIALTLNKSNPTIVYKISNYFIIHIN